MTRRRDTSGVRVGYIYHTVIYIYQSGAAGLRELHPKRIRVSNRRRARARLHAPTSRARSGAQSESGPDPRAREPAGNAAAVGRASGPGRAQSGLSQCQVAPAALTSKNPPALATVAGGFIFMALAPEKTKGASPARMASIARF